MSDQQPGPQQPRPQLPRPQQPGPPGPGSRPPGDPGRRSRADSGSGSGGVPIWLVGGLVALVVLGLLAAYALTRGDQTAVPPPGPGGEASGEPTPGTSETPEDGSGDTRFAKLAVGDCVHVFGPASAPEHREVACADTSATESLYTVGVVNEDGSVCPEGNWVEYFQYSGNESTGPRNLTTCLAINMAADRCYGPGPEELEVELECSSEQAYFKIEKRLDADDVAQCKMPDKALRYPELPRTYCLVAPE